MICVKNRIYIGDEHDRWMEIKTAFRLETNSEVANIIFVSIYIPLFSIQSTIKNNYYEIKNVCFLSHSCLLGQINFK
jgi:Na+/alanine symporter